MQHRYKDQLVKKVAAFLYDKGIAVEIGEVQDGLIDKYGERTRGRTVSQDAEWLVDRSDSPVTARQDLQLYLPEKKGASSTIPPLTLQLY